MAFSLDDLLDRMGLAGKKQGRECYREELASLKKATREEIATMFPSVTLSESKEVIYAPFRLCHSLPKVNLRGRCFTPKTLSNSFASVRDGLVNVDHQMGYRSKQAGNNDTICGHMVCGRFDPFNQFKDEMASMTKLPVDPIPLAALAAFYLRSQYIPAFLEEHLSGTRKWLTSMECAHSWEDAAFYYRGEVIPIKDAQPGMRECVEKLSVKPFKGHQLALALGGANGKVDFHAAALTPTPADTDADIMAFVTKDEYMEAANDGTSGGVKNLFFFPLETKTFTAAPEVIAGDEETTVDELANISILGQTDASPDGHAHDVLSDMTVMPHNDGHDHSMATTIITKGTNPRLSGRTGNHHKYTRDPNTGTEKSHTHLHTFNIPLRGKAAKPGTKADEQSNLPSATELFFVPVISDAEYPVDKLLERMLAVLAAGKFEGQMATEVASLSTDLRKTSQADYLKTLVKTEIANLTATGELITKEDHNKQLETSLREATDKAAAAQEEAKKRASRREQVVGMGFDMDAKFKEGIEMTVGQFVDSFALDAAADNSFQVALASLETIKKLSEAPAAAATPVTETQAANDGKGKPATPGDKAKPKMLLAGRGGNGEEEAALNAKKKSDSKLGRNLFKSAI